LTEAANHGSTGHSGIHSGDTRVVQRLVNGFKGSRGTRVVQRLVNGFKGFKGYEGSNGYKGCSTAVCPFV